MVRKRTISVKGSVINIIDYQNSDYISLTDMVKSFGDEKLFIQTGLETGIRLNLLEFGNK